MKPNHKFLEALQRRKISAAVAIALLAIPGLALNVWPAVTGWSSWGVDFNQFYSAGHLVGTGHLYDWDALRKIEAERNTEVPCARLPIVLYGHKYLARLPYGVARSIWLAGSIVSLILFAFLWPGARRMLMMVALAWSMPAILILVYGQDLAFWLMFFAAGLALLERKRPWSAGFAFSLCICKFHLALGIPIMLMAQKRWKTLIAGTAAVLVWLALSFMIEPDWLPHYVKIVQMPEFSPGFDKMPNLHGIASWLPQAASIEVVLVIAVVLLLWMACRDNTDLGMAGAAAAAAGLLLANHSYSVDCVLLIPLALLTVQRQSGPMWITVWSLFLLSPMPVLLIVSDKPLLGQLLVVAFVVTVISLTVARQTAGLMQSMKLMQPVTEPRPLGGVHAKTNDVMLR